MKQELERLKQAVKDLEIKINNLKLIKLGPIELNASGFPLKLNFKEANEYARLKGTRLPTKAEIELLPKSELNDVSFWSSEPNGFDFAWGFSGYGFVYSGTRSFRHRVRCVLEEV